MRSPLQIRFFAHSLVSDWNHGNAHFLRGLCRALLRMGHTVRAYEELGCWSLSNLVNNEGDKAIAAINEFRATYPDLDIRFYRNDHTLDRLIEEELKGADVVVIHEWTEPAVANKILAQKRKHGYKVLFHDTHHRAYTRANEILRFHLHLVDGVLAFGETIRRIYSDGFGVPRTWTFHEAADVEVFTPQSVRPAVDLLWIGNWGDEERTRELHQFLLSPSLAMKGKWRVVVHGVRYPAEALEKLREAGIEYRGYLPNLWAPRAYGEARLSLHVPRRQYANGLSGIPTIRVFEALSCGATLVCSPWEDTEHLFRSGEDYVCVTDENDILAEVDWLLRDDRARMQIAANGLETVRRRHTCSHRAQQFTAICEDLAE
jgi:spore maturation protein CgeB